MTRRGNTSHPVRLAKGVAKKIASKVWKRYDMIGPYRVRLPVNSRLLAYKRAFKLQDTPLGEVARVVRSKYPDVHAIDIGANVGDTAALIRKAGNIPVLCIEGDPELLPILKENADVIGPGITIEPSFIGTDGQTVDPGLIVDLGRNASIKAAIKDKGLIKLRSLQSILKDHPTFCEAKLLKTDTEGFDFDILRQSLEFIRSSKPVIFFEYDPGFSIAEPKAGLDTISALIDAGYSDFVYYDNYGNFLIHVMASQFSILTDLDNYLASNRAFGIAVYYFDVCAFHRHDADLVVKLRSSSPAYAAQMR
jgi:FkbM family methyltransferase